MTTDDDGLFPAGDEAGDVVNDNGFTEDGAIPANVRECFRIGVEVNLQDVSDGTVRGKPH